MKISIDPPPASELIVRRPWLKAAGLAVLTVAIVLVVFWDYWPLYLRDILLRLGVSRPVATDIAQTARYLPWFGIAVGGYLISKSREKPLYPTKDDV